MRFDRWILAIPVLASCLILTGPASGFTPAGSSVALNLGPEAGGAQVAHVWSQQSPSSSPAVRTLPMMAYDPPLNETVLFGGYNPSVAPRGDTWVYQAGAWTNLTSKLSPHPAARWAGASAYDPTLHGVLLFGGRSTAGFFNDTWLFNSHGWRQLAPSTSPPHRASMAMAYDPIDGYMLLFGGGHVNIATGSSWVYSNQTWAFSGGSWQKLASAPISPRVGAHLLYEPGARHMFLFGGNALVGGSAVPQNDSWYFVHGSWKRITTPSAPPSYTGAGMIGWDPASKAAILFGGQDRFGTPSNETWAYQGGKWANLTGSLSVAPAPRSVGGLVFDVVDGYLLLFGGTTPPPNFTDRNDTWSFV